MKKIKVLLVACTMMIATSAMAQGPWWIEGGLGFQSESGTYYSGTDMPKTSGFNINAGLNYQLNDNWSIGGTLGFESYNAEKGGYMPLSLGQKYSSSLFSINLHADYGVSLSSRWSWAPRISAGVGFGSGTFENIGIKDIDVDLFQMEFKIRTIAFNYRVSNNVVLNMGLDLGDLYYRSTKYSNSDWAKDNKVNQAGFQFGSYNQTSGNIGLTLGLHYHF